jgi:ankyrin repeat protein
MVCPSRFVAASDAQDAPAVVRWLVTVAGAPLEERDGDGTTPLMVACREKAWAAAHALLDCGARVAVHTQATEGGWWPLRGRARYHHWRGPDGR